MDYDYKFFSEHIKAMSCIVSVEKFPDGSYGNICLHAANDIFFERSRVLIEKSGDAAIPVPEFIPDQPYERYIPKDLNFEDFCYRSAVLGKTLHTYIRPDRSPLWMYLTAIPLQSDRENIGYCAYIQEFTFEPDYSLMTNISPDAASQVLQICMKLRGTHDFMSAISDVIKDIRDMCGAGHCCILQTDFARRKCSVLCEALSETTTLASMKKYVNDDFFGIIDTWHGSIGGSTCVIIKDERDWKYLEQTNPIWYNSMKPAGAESIVLFPLKYRKETLGFIWAINFDTSLTLKIKEMLELATYFLASEIASYQLFSRLETMSSMDMLTGVNNRNAMDNRVDGIKSALSGEQPIKSGDKAGIVIVDLNGLKRVNDTEGHLAGDLLLKNSAILLQKFFPESEIYRAGGDEFMVLSENLSEDEFRKRVTALKEASCDPEGISFAIGWCYDDIGSIGKSLKTADENMYADKQAYYERYPDRIYQR